MKKTLKKITCGALAAMSVFGCAASLTACETSHPEVQMQIEFNGKAYTLDYKLYRKVAPKTVEHFLYLAGKGYYDGLAVHDYDGDSAMYTGGYSVSETSATELVYKQYYSEVAAFGGFPTSIWLDSGKNTPAYTLMGEFESNGFRVENGALKESFGSLAMYYHDIDEDIEGGFTKVYADYQKKGKEDMRSMDYRYNQTTSLFSISLSATEKTNADYCTFAKLDKDSKSVLESLQKAIADYAGEDEFTQDVTVKLFEDDEILRDYDLTEDFDTPTKAIVIKKVKVKKY